MPHTLTRYNPVLKNSLHAAGPATHRQLCHADTQVDALEDQVQTTLLTLARTELQAHEAVRDMLHVPTCWSERRIGLPTSVSE